MGWAYLLLVALLFRIAIAQFNTFTAPIPDIIFDTPFTISWEPVTEGTVTVIIVELDDNNVEVSDFAVLGGTLCLPYTHF